MPSDQVRLVIEGREFWGWTGVTISQAVDQAADAFSISAPLDPDVVQIRDSFRPFGYQECQLYIDNDRILTGRIDSVNPRTDGRERKLTVQGRSLAGQIVDCSIDGPLEYSGKRLADIAIPLCEPFGITVRWDNNTDPIEIARARYGQRVYEFLLSLAAPHNLLLHSAPTGELVITWATWFPDRAPVAALIEGQGSVLSVETQFDGTNRFSLYRAATQFAGEVDIQGDAADSGVPITRPLLFDTDEMDADPRLTAARKRTEALASAFSASVTLSGWRDPGGNLWSKREIGRRIVPPTVTLRAPGAMLYNEAKYTAVGMALKIDEDGGKVTELQLVQPELYAGLLPRVVPWAS